MAERDGVWRTSHAGVLAYAESVHTRPELWQRPVSRVAASGGRNFRLAPTVRSRLIDTGVELIERPLREEDGSVSPDVREADILISGGASIDQAVARELRDVRVLVRPYVGYDDIDVDALTDWGILLANVPDAFIQEVADHTLALILACNRKLLQTDAFVRHGAWSGGAHNREASIPLRRISALTLGLVGFGNIARLVLERARPFGLRIVAYDPYVSAEAARAVGVSLLSLDELLAQADIVSIHVLLSAETRHLIDERRLALMKPGAIIVNTSRGPVIDENALVAALQAGRLAGAGLDVFEVEPIPADSPLLRMPNVILTSHVASYSEEGDVAHQQRTLEIVSRLVSGDLPERKVVVNKALYDDLTSRLRKAPA
jgi:D-3-phosphoglycerate dehydrogenase